MSSSDEARTARGPYAKTATVRRKIIEACLEVFNESGYRAMTVKAVAERAGMSQRGLVHHFATKEALLFAVLEARDQADSEGAPELGSARALSSVLTKHFENMHKGTLLELHTVLAAEAISRDHPAHEYYSNRYAELRFYLTAAFDALQADGLFDPKANSSTLASMIIGLMDGLQVQWLYDPASVNVEKSFDVFLSAIGLDVSKAGSTQPAVARRSD
ncbi:TetR/AcrR family transcriptional regulator [Cryobacterium lactosi]|nr:TetR/AcrR family transcriptional regulator [Cryobacterium lactosi]